MSLGDGSIPSLSTMPKFKSKPPSLILEFQEQVGLYPRAEFKQDGMRIADLTFVSLKVVKPVVDLLREAGVEVTTDEYTPIKGKR